MSDDEPIAEKTQDDDPSINPYEAPHYVEGEPEPLHKMSGIEIAVFGVNAIFSIAIGTVLIVLIIQPETPDQRRGGIICIVPLMICAVLEFAAVLTLRAWVRRILGIADIIFGALFTVLFFIAITLQKTDPSIASTSSALVIAMLVGIYFVLCGAYRLYRTKHGEIVPVATPVERSERNKSASKVV